MALGVLLAVFACCGFATYAAWQRLQRVKAVQLFDEAHALDAARRSGLGALLELPISAKYRDALTLAVSQGRRALIASSNEALLEIHGRLERGALLTQLAWRICAAAASAGVLLVVWTDRWAAVAIGGVGFCAALGSSILGRSADLRARQTRAAWNALMRALLGSFPNQGEQNETQ